MRVGIEALEFDQYGGGQIVSVEFIRLLQEFGHHVIVFCNKHFTSKKLIAIRKKWRLGPFDAVYVPDLRNVSLNSVIFSFIQIKYHLDCYFSVGLLILTKTWSNHIPTFRYALAPHTPFLYRKFRNLLKHGTGIYYFFRFAEIFLNMFLDTPGRYAKKRLVLSNFIRSLYKRAYNMDYTVLHPPVYQDDLKALKVKDTKTIICLGRIDEQKNYPIVVKLAERYPDLQFHIIGGYSPNRPNQRVYKLLSKASRRLTNLKVEINAPRERIVEVLASNQFLLHTMKDEHFGIAIVEALRCGMTPIVAKNSGPDEIINYGNYGHHYDSFLDLIFNFKKYLVPIDQDRLIERARAFDLHKFRAEARRYMEEFFNETFREKKKLHVGFLGAWPPDKVGESRYDEYLIKTLLKNYKSIEFDLICEKYQSIPEPVVDNRLRVHHVFNPKDILYPFKIFTKYIAMRPHVIHIQFGPNNKQFGGVLGEPMLVLLFLLKLARIPTTLTLHTAFLRSQAAKAAFLKYGNDQIAKLTRVVFLFYTKMLYNLVSNMQLNTPKMNSRFTSLFLKDYGLNGKKIVEIPHPCFPGIKIPSSEARQKLKIQEGTFCIFSFGFIARRKGFMFLVKAADILKNQYNFDDFLIIIAGKMETRAEEPYLKEMQEYIASHALSTKVRLIPEYIPHEELPAYLAAANIFVFPYTYIAGVSGSLNSVIYQEKPIIVSNSGLQFKESVYGSLVSVPPCDEMALAKKIRELKENTALFDSLTIAYRQFYRENNLDVMARRVLSYYIYSLKSKAR